MREYQFNIEDYEKIVYSTFIHWASRDCKNYLIGRVTLIMDTRYPKDTRWVIEYFKDCLEAVKDIKAFTNIPAFPLRWGLVKQYPVGKLPYFIEQRIINKKRPDLPDVLKSLNMKYLVPLEYIDKTHGVHIENRFFVSHNEDATAFYSKALHYYLLNENSRKTKEEFEDLYGVYKEDGILRTSERL